MSDLSAEHDALSRFCDAVLRAAGADGPSAAAASQAMIHASLLGVDSHGVRLLPHYDKVLRGGRLNGTPHMTFERKRAGSGILDADHGHGALAAYTACEHACTLARGRYRRGGYPPHIPFWPSGRLCVGHGRGWHDWHRYVQFR